MRGIPTGILFLFFATTVAAQDPMVLAAPWSESGAYDGARERFVVICNHGLTQEWDGLAWRVRPHEPLPTNLTSLAYDTSRESLLLVGRSIGAANLLTYRSRGTSWELLQPPVAPPSLGLFAMAFDQAHRELVLFGGFAQGNRADTWIFDGSTWSLRQPSATPAGRAGHAMTYDAARNRVVMFGGGGNNVLHDDTWEWDGVNWSLRLLTLHPAGRSLPTMTYDPIRSRVLMFGGMDTATELSDLWEYDGAQWSSRSPTGPAPTARAGALAYFAPQSGEVVFAGGYGQVDPLYDAWAWNGTAWRALPGLPPAPPRRHEAQLVADPIGPGLVLTGGIDDSNQFQNDSWRWSGSAWELLNGTRPSARIGAATAGALPNSYLFGGYNGLPSNSLLNDLWGWDGTVWQLVPTTGMRPAPRTNASMAYDYGNALVILFGGQGTLTFGDTWAFDGVQWTQRATTGPSPRILALMAEDFLRGQIVLYGGAPDYWSTRLGDTWLWNGSQWAQSPASGPPGLIAATMDYDPLRQRVVMVDAGGYYTATQMYDFDGLAWNARVVSPSTMFFPGARAIGGLLARSLTIVDNDFAVFSYSASPSQVHDYGTPCGTAAPIVSATRWPQVDSTDFAIEIAAAPANSFVALLGATSASSVTIGGCTLLVTPGQLVLVLPTSQHGVARQQLPLPNTFALVGVSLFFQAAAWQPMQPAGVTLSSGLEVLLGI